MITRKCNFGSDARYLDEEVSSRSYTKLGKTRTGGWLTGYIDEKQLNVNITYVAQGAAIPGVKGKPAGYCKDAPRGKRYEVWIAAGFVGKASEMRCPKGHTWIVPDSVGLFERLPCPICNETSNPGFGLVDRVKDRPALELAKTTFHELLHAWFMTEFPTGTGHDATVEPQVGAFGVTTYSSHGIDARFLEKLRQFDREVR